jgi:hypothetical protein
VEDEVPAPVEYGGAPVVKEKELPTPGEEVAAEVICSPME